MKKLSFKKVLKLIILDDIFYYWLFLFSLLVATCMQIVCN